ncbi:AmmeMemoRadiSam system protein B [Candidatus Peregrinibacteria bacterium]|nr:AmmeMemoRadiSam system protein B [Candidatus Peregrinibacteria bacterium]
MSSKSPNVAGTFYPKNPKILSKMIDDFLESAKKDSVKIPGKIRGIIVPHAGYIYSGAVAAYGFLALQKEVEKHFSEKNRIVLLAPSHFFPFSGGMAADFDAFETPLGKIPAHNILDDLSEKSHSIKLGNDAYEEEHALEVEIPFLQKICANTSAQILPVLLGDAHPEDIALDLEHFTNGENTYFVVSSDLSHYHPEHIAREKDLAFCEAAQNGDFETVSCGEACGIIGILSLMDLAQKRNWKTRCLKYENSALTSGDFSRVVGYGAFAFYETA